MATIAELLQAANRKISHLEQIKTALKSAINGSGSTVGDKFADYPPAITDGKAYIAQKITAKGVPTDANATFKQIGDNVEAIETGTKGTAIEQFVFYPYDDFGNEQFTIDFYGVAFSVSGFSGAVSSNITVYGTEVVVDFNMGSIPSEGIVTLSQPFDLLECVKKGLSIKAGSFSYAPVKGIKLNISSNGKVLFITELSE